MDVEKVVIIAFLTEFFISSRPKFQSCPHGRNLGSQIMAGEGGGWFRMLSLCSRSYRTEISWSTCLAGCTGSLPLFSDFHSWHGVVGSAGSVRVVRVRKIFFRELSLFAVWMQMLTMCCRRGSWHCPRDFSLRYHHLQQFDYYYWPVLNSYNFSFLQLFVVSFNPSNQLNFSIIVTCRSWRKLVR